nr:hypothetical protein [Streptomyces sp. RLB1-33]
MNPVAPPTPVRHAGPPTAGPEYLDVPQLSEIPPQGAVPWGAPPVGPEGTAAETVVPSDVQGPEAGVVVEAVTVPEAAPVAEVPEAVEAAEFAPVPQLAEAVEEVGAQGLAQVPQAPETAHTPAASEGHLVQQAVEVAPSPEAVAGFEAAPGSEATPAPDGFPAPEVPEATPASTPFPVAQDLPHAAPTVDDTAGHLVGTPAQASAAGEPLAAEQVLQPAQDPQSTPAAEPGATEQAPQLADQAAHLAEPAAQAVDQAPQFPAQDAQFPEAGVHIPEPAVQLADTGMEPVAPAEAAQPEFAPEPLVVSAAQAAAEAQAQVARAADDSYGQSVPGAEAFPAQAAQFAAPAEAHAAFAEAGAGVPVGVAAHAQVPHAATNQSHGEHHPGDTAGAPGFQGAPWTPPRTSPLAGSCPSRARCRRPRTSLRPRRTP